MHIDSRLTVWNDTFDVDALCLGSRIRHFEVFE
jgi:hypothetical protein